MLKMRELPEYQRQPVRAAVLTAMVFGLCMGFGAGFAGSSANSNALPSGFTRAPRSYAKRALACGPKTGHALSAARAAGMRSTRTNCEGQRQQAPRC